MSDPAFPTAPAPAPPAAPRWSRLLEWLHRWRYALAPLSFGAGLASFLLIERQEALAQWLGALLLLGWLLIVAEENLARRLRLSPAVLRFGVQAIQQETFFFTLPFFLHTTTWNTGQAAFTAAALLAGFCSMWDPLYYGRIVVRPWLYVTFHAFAVYVGTLTVAPILLHLTTQQTVAVAAVSIAVLSVAGLRHLIDRSSALQRALIIGGAAALGGLAWSIRPWVPPATLWIEQALVTTAVDPRERRPGLALHTVPAAHLHAQGLYAWTAIHAPRGLREMVWHRWLHDGREVDRVSLDIVGGRKEGYRAWSYKRGFPQDPRGRWQVEVVTDGGQLIGRFAFEVVGEAPGPAPLPPEPMPPPAGGTPETPAERLDQPPPPLETPVEPAPEEQVPDALPEEELQEPAPAEEPPPEDLRT